ncbi:MAG: hypothetical protein ACREFP_22740, partial [Acetobacteraceae bacterium]
MSRAPETSSWLTLRFQRGTRYYRLHLEQDLWHTWIVTHVHGRCGTPLGRHWSTPVATIDRALLHM